MVINICRCLSAILPAIFFLMQFCSCVMVNDRGNPKDFAGEYSCISLNRFINELGKSVETRTPFPEEMDSLYGLSWLDGYLYDKENSEIILIGKCLANRSAYHAEDILVNIQNVIDSASAPYCSLDPYPDNILKFNNLIKENFFADFKDKVEDISQAIGNQKIVTVGVPSNSRHARIMIYADYDLKKISQGLLKIDGIQSCLDLSASDTIGYDDVSSTMSRFWLCVDDNGNSYPSFDYYHDLILIDECPVIVKTEEQIADQEGKLHDRSAGENKIAEAFASDVSINYDTLARQDLLFTELENLFRLQACLKSMEIEGVLNGTGNMIEAVIGIKLAPGNELPESLQGLVNYRIVEKKTEYGDRTELLSKFFLVAGGVDQKIILMKKNKKLNNSLARLGKSVTEARPKQDAVFWKTRIPVKKKGFLDHFKIEK